MRHRTYARVAAGLFGSSAAFTTGAFAQELDTIVVSAERREENVQDVPIAINAFDAQTIDRQRIQEFQDLALRIPGFSISAFQKSRLNPSLRGGSSSLPSAGAEGAVGLFIDDQYFGGPGDFEVDLFDVERIEVLRGPQGTLFGRNTTGGSINVVTRNPSDEFEAIMDVTYGNFNQVQVRGLLTGPITDTLSGLITMSSTDRGGTSFNEVTGNDIDNINKASIRGKLLWEPTDDFRALLTASFTRRDETGIARDAIFLDDPITNSQLVDLGFVPDDEPRVVQQFDDGRYVSNQVTVGLRFEKDTPYGQFLSIGSFRSFDSDHAEASLAGVPIQVFSIGEPRQVTALQQEFRFVSDFDSPFNIVSGVFLYYSDEGRTVNATTTWDAQTFGGAFQAISFCPFQTDADFNGGVVNPGCLTNDPVTIGNQTVTLGSLFDTNGFRVFEQVETISVAPFAEATLELTDWFSVIAGGRWTYDEKSLVGGSDGAPDFFWNPDPGFRIDTSENWSDFTWRFGVTIEPTDAILLYATASKGFRSGVFDLARSDPGSLGVPVDPETNISYEGGIKSRWFDDRVQLNVTYFDVTYRDLQFFINTGPASLSTNAGEANVNGVELEFVGAVTPELTASFQWSHQNGTSSDIPPEAELTPGVPPAGTVPNTYIASLNYAKEMANGNLFTVDLDWTRKDRFGLEFNDVPQFQSEVRNLFNARVGYEFADGRWSIAAWGKNLANEDIVIYGQDFWFAFYDGPSLFANEDVSTETAQPRYAEPRTYGVTLRHEF